MLIIQVGQTRARLWCCQSVVSSDYSYLGTGMDVLMQVVGIQEAVSITLVEEVFSSRIVFFTKV